MGSREDSRSRSESESDDSDRSSTESTNEQEEGERSPTPQKKSKKSKSHKKVNTDGKEMGYQSGPWIPADLFFLFCAQRDISTSYFFSLKRN